MARLGGEAKKINEALVQSKTLPQSGTPKVRRVVNQIDTPSRARFVYSGSLGGVCALRDN
jgi:hypothetical protein